ncbi:MAG TPA: hotdog fold thioesterase [Acetobacteraceae bacterium]|nr:hotdog fold thioesterase [Acetobacteraceae bacterium]
MSLWKRTTTPAEMERHFASCLPGRLGIRIRALHPDSIEAEMPVDERHIQPAGILHGGASVVLSETLGSIATTLTLPETQFAVGIEVNANHLASVRAGETVTAICRPLHVGGRVQVWQTEIRRADGRLACVSRLTTQVLDRR